MTNLQRERVVITPGGGEGVQGCERNLGWGPQNTRGQLFFGGRGQDRAQRTRRFCQRWEECVEAATNVTVAPADRTHGSHARTKSHILKGQTNEVCSLFSIGHSDELIDSVGQRECICGVRKGGKWGLGTRIDRWLLELFLSRAVKVTRQAGAGKCRL